MFCGMSEPLLNPDCLKMLQLACDAGRNVLLYTTLEGATKEDIDKILQLQFQFVGLHAPDEKNYAHITVTEEYYCNFERLLNAKRKDGNPFVNNITAQANPLPRIAKMCEGKYEVLISLQDRAGNLEGDELASREHILTNERITCCLGGSKFNTNVLLPDGTLLLCDSDFGMQHVLGNLKEQTYDEIRRGEEMKKIFRGVAGDQGVDLLCRKCVLAMIER
jgi:radical SAM protein with 4Fe4S-binding SPASM domain